MKTIVSGQESVAHILGVKRKRTVSLLEIKKILPHRGRMLLLQEVVFKPELVCGCFRVSKEACAGHAVLSRRLVFKGSDYCDMAAQVLGVWAFHATKTLSLKKGCVATNYGETALIKPTRPGEVLLMEIKPEDMEMVIIENGQGRRLIRLTGMGFVAKVGNEVKATVLSVEAVGQ